MDLKTWLKAPPASPVVLGRERQHLLGPLYLEGLTLRFSNSVERRYWRFSGGPDAVLAVPFDGENFYLSSEYACGFERSELSFVKGKIDEGESPAEAAARELREELGISCRKVTPLKEEALTVAPGMMSLKIYGFLCTDLSFGTPAGGDEPEPITCVKVSCEQARELLFKPASPLREGVALACLTQALHLAGRL